MTIGRHGNSVRRLGHAGDDGQSRSLAGGAGRHRDVVGRLADEGGHLLNLAKDEHLAPKALVTPAGETYAMVAPTITKDIFILVNNTGQARRMDVGDSEGHRMPFVVQSIIEDGGTPWYVEFWHWIAG
ncbi:MAG: hypothetical protein KC643_29835 [Nitrospira sp.]|nr:hypothetical protein [Nitrospira sp.]